jgi:transposase InsO family protein
MGHQGLSDFTHPDTKVTIGGKPFPHLIYQFRLAYSGWRDAHITQGGESYSALAEGLQNALIKLGGSPAEHRTDSLTAAYNNHYQEQQLTKNYRALCEHYGITATRNTKGVSHENGAVETAHRSLKHRIRQAIALRGHADFETIADYQQLLNRCTQRLNDYTKAKLKEEKAHLQPLPKMRFMDYSLTTAKVTSTSTIEVKRAVYSVPSRLVGETLSIHLYHDKLHGFIGQALTLEVPRIYPDKAGQRVRRIDYRHVINALAAKPQAFRFSVFRDDLFPDDNYRKLWQHIEQVFDSKLACKWMVTVLKIASTHKDERQFGQDLLAKVVQGEAPDIKQLQNQFLPKNPTPDIQIKQHNLDDYDQLISSQPSLVMVNAHNVTTGGVVCYQ